MADFWEAPAGLASDLATAAADVGRALKEALEPDGLNLITSAGSAAEQTVFHLHVHIVPRWHDDGFGPIWTQEALASKEELVDLGARVRRQLDGLG